MPSFSSPSPPISTRLVDDPRPLPGAQAPLTNAPLTYKASPVSIPAKSPPATRADSVPPPAVKERNSPNGTIDREVFDQVLELDDEEELFSKDMVDAYFVQADMTFEKMDAALAKKDLSELADLGHFLKGSSAALGVSKVKASCEQIQDYGRLKEASTTTSTTITEADAIAKITKSLARAREEYQEAKTWLLSFYTTYPSKD